MGHCWRKGVYTLTHSNPTHSTYVHYYVRNCALASWRITGLAGYSYSKEDFRAHFGGTLSSKQNHFFHHFCRFRLIFHWIFIAFCHSKRVFELFLIDKVMLFTTQVALGNGMQLHLRRIRKWFSSLKITMFVEGGWSKYLLHYLCTLATNMRCLSHNGTQSALLQFIHLFL